MKRNLFSLLLIFLFIFTSCEKETVLSVDQTSLSYTDTGGSQTISLTANKPWSVKCDQSWCKVSPSSGEEAVSSKISISCDANTSYDARNCIVTFTCAELTKTVSISQATNNGLLLSQTSYELTKAAQQFNIQVQANVKFSVEVDAGCKDWITYKTTKGLTTNTVVLDIAENKSYDSRQGQVTIKQDGGNLSSTITIKQSQLDGLFISTPEYNLSNEQHTLTVEVSTNVEFDVTPQDDWVKYVQTKGLNSKQIILEVAENDTYDQRETTVSVKQKNGDLSGTIKIKQDEKYDILVKQSEYTLSNEAQTIDVEVKYNVDFDVVIPDECKDWVSIVGTKGLSSRTYTFSIAKNETYDNRECPITFKQKNGALSGTTVIKQAQTDYLAAESENYVVSNEAQTLRIKIESNIQYNVEIEESSQSWISKTGTKAINDTYLNLDISKNEGDARVGKITIRGNAESVNVIIDQEGIYPIIYYTSTDGQLIYPNSAEEYDNVKLEYISNTYENGIGKLVLRDTVKVLPMNAFAYSNTLKSIRISNGISAIGRNTFMCCEELEKVELPQSLTTIERRAFSTCSSLRAIEIPQSVSTISIAAFISCEKLESFRFPEGIKEISDGLFWGCLSLRDVYIPESVETIGSQSFQGCSSLETIIIPNSVTSIWGLAFGYCSSLKSINIPSSVKTIGGRAFAECHELETLVLNEGINSLGSSAFENCTNLKSITTPKSLHKIDTEAFSGCTSLVSANISEGIEELWSTFSDCTSLVNVSLPQSVKSLSATFSGCTSLKTIDLPDSVLSLAGTFVGCTSLQKVIVPNSVSILATTFANCTSLTTVVLSDFLKEIGNSAFEGCSNLQSIVIPESVTTLGYHAFKGCNSLESITVPKYVNYLGGGVFIECKNLKSVIMLPTMPPVLEYPQSAWYNLFPKGITIIIPKGSMEAYCSAPGWLDFDNSSSGHYVEQE